MLLEEGIINTVFNLKLLIQGKKKSLLALVPVVHFMSAIINDLAVYRRAVRWKRQLNIWGSVKEVSLPGLHLG